MPLGPEPTYHERLLADAIVKIAVASGVNPDHLTGLTGPMVLDLAEQTADWVARLYRQSEVARNEKRRNELGDTFDPDAGPIGPPMTLSAAHALIERVQEERARETRRCLGTPWCTNEIPPALTYCDDCDPYHDPKCALLPNPDGETCMTQGVGRDRACDACQRHYPSGKAAPQ